MAILTTCPLGQTCKQTNRNKEHNLNMTTITKNATKCNITSINMNTAKNLIKIINIIVIIELKQMLTINQLLIMSHIS